MDSIEVKRANARRYRPQQQVIALERDEIALRNEPMVLASRLDRLSTQGASGANV